MTLPALPLIGRAPCRLARWLRRRRGREPHQDPPEVVPAVHHQSTVRFTHHSWDSHADLCSFGEITGSFGRSSSSSTPVLRSLRSTRGQLGRHSWSHQWVIRATTMGMLGTLPRIAACQGRQTHLILQHQWPTSKRASREAQRSDLATPTTLLWRRYQRERKSLWVCSFSSNTPSLYRLILGLRMIS
jgi:hypothetical protein